MAGKDTTEMPLFHPQIEVDRVKLEWTPAREVGAAVADFGDYRAAIIPARNGEGYAWGISDVKNGVILRSGENRARAIDAQVDANAELARILDADAYRAAVQRERARDVLDVDADEAKLLSEGLHALGYSRARFNKNDGSLDAIAELQNRVRLVIRRRRTMTDRFQAAAANDDG